MQDARDLAIIIRSQVPVVVLETHDEKNAQDLLLRVSRQQDKTLYRWTVTDGLQTAGFGLQLEQGNEYTGPEEMLTHVKARAQPGIYMLCDLHPWLADQPKVVRLLKDIAIKYERGPVTLVLVSHRFDLPAELERYAARFTLSLPGNTEILALVKEEARNWAKRHEGEKVRASPEALSALAATLKGLSHSEVKRLAKIAICDDGAVTEADVPAINKAKFQLMGMDGVLSYSFESEDFGNLGGMDNLKVWLNSRKQAFLNRDERRLDSPKGVLLLGVQGGGKSLAAKSVSGLWQIPMLRLDMGALYNKYFGETERNLREALQLADQMSPCVLWLDEIEKGISTADSDGGLSQRVLGALLTWMQERTSQVFMVATANDISRLPPELLRKGRFDEIFFVDLPDDATRHRIFRIHLDKRQLDSGTFDLATLVEVTEGFSGAEIEQAVVSALYSASHSPSALDTQAILDEILSTAPLSHVMAEKLGALRAWAEERRVRQV
jgi:ATPase family associated with various cellular activities (AAA)